MAPRNQKGVSAMPTDMPPMPVLPGGQDIKTATADAQKEFIRGLVDPQGRIDLSGQSREDMAAIWANALGAQRRNPRGALQQIFDTFGLAPEPWRGAPEVAQRPSAMPGSYGVTGDAGAFFGPATIVQQPAPTPQRGGPGAVLNQLGMAQPTRGTGFQPMAQANQTASQSFRAGNPDVFGPVNLNLPQYQTNGQTAAGAQGAWGGPGLRNLVNLFRGLDVSGVGPGGYKGLTYDPVRQTTALTEAGLNPLGGQQVPTAYTSLIPRPLPTVDFETDLYAQPLGAPAPPKVAAAQEGKPPTPFIPPEMSQLINRMVESSSTGDMTDEQFVQYFALVDQIGDQRERLATEASVLDPDDPAFRTIAVQIDSIDAELIRLRDRFNWASGRDTVVKDRKRQDVDDQLARAAQEEAVGGIASRTQASNAALSQLFSSLFPGQPELNPAVFNEFSLPDLIGLFRLLFQQQQAAAPAAAPMAAPAPAAPAQPVYLRPEVEYR